MKRFNLILFILAMSSVANTQVTNGLQLKYSFNSQNTLDESGNGKHGVGINLTDTTDRFGNLNHAYYFNGSSSVLTLPDSLFSIYRPFTVSMWFKTNSQGVLMAYQTNAYPTSSNAFVPMLYVRQDSTLNAKLWNGATGNTNSRPDNIVDNKWHHIVIMGNSGTQMVYVDNRLTGTGTGVGYIANAIKNQIGAGQTNGWSSSPTGFFHYRGYVDDVRVYKRMLNRVEIDSLFNEANPYKPIDMNYRLIAKYSFDSQNVNDESGNGNNGIAYNLSSATDRNGNVNQAYSFNGSSSYIDLPKGLLLHQQITISMWIKTNSNGVIIAQQSNPISISSSGYVPLFVVGQDSLLGAKIWDGRSGNILGRINIADGNWHHLLISGDYSGQIVFVDNVQQGFNSTSTSVISSLINNQIGVGFARGWSSAPTSQFYFDGLIDDVHIYNRRIIDRSEVDSLFGSSNPTSLNKVNMDQEFVVFPNPTNDFISIKSEHSVDKVSLFSMDGKLIMVENSSFINLAKLNKGMYLLKINSRGNIVVKRIIKN